MGRESRKSRSASTNDESLASDASVAMTAVEVIAPESPADIHRETSAMAHQPAADEDPSSAAQESCESSLPLACRVEVILITSDKPLSAGRIADLLGLETGPAALREIDEVIASLNDQYAASGRAFRIERVAGGYRMMTLPAYGAVMRRAREVGASGKLSQAALETLAIVAYRQPITRADVETIRGVACGEVLRTLLDRRLIRIAGRAEEVGRPMLYGTTREFLEAFGLASLSDLPQASDLKGVVPPAAPSPAPAAPPPSPAESPSGSPD